MYRISWFILFVSLLVLLSPEAGMGAELVKLENSVFKISVDPSRGGRVSSLVCKKDNIEWIDEKEAGLFLDLFTQQTWPGEFLSRKYEYKIDGNSVLLWTTCRDQTKPSIYGLKLEKRITVSKNSPSIDVTYRISNPTSERKTPVLWIQNVVSPAGIGLGRVSHRPTTEGTLSEVFNPGKQKRNKAGEFRLDPTAGWMAIMAPEKREGLVFLMDYNYLKCLYCHLRAKTQEWWYELVQLQPGESFETCVRVFPVFGLSAVHYADENVVAEFSLTRESKNAKNISAAIKLTEGPDGLSADSLKLKIETYPNRDVLMETTFPLSFKDDPIQQFQIHAKGIREEMDLLGRAELLAKNNKTSVEVFNAGAATLMTETKYRTPRPARNRKIAKPEQISKVRNKSLKILHFRGLYSDYYRWDQIARELGAKYQESLYIKAVVSSEFSYMPKNYDELMSYDLIVLNHIPCDVITDEFQEYLKDFVHEGGVLIIIGGPFCETPRDVNYLPKEILPVQQSVLSRMKAVESPFALSPEHNAGWCYWWLGPKREELHDDIRLVTGSNDNPTLIYRKIDKGVSALFTPLCMGRSRNMKMGFWESPGYVPWMAGQVKTLLGQTYIYGGEK